MAPVETKKLKKNDIFQLLSSRLLCEQVWYFKFHEHSLYVVIKHVHLFPYFLVAA